MRAMKLRVTGKRWSTSLGSWSVPFVRSASPSFSQLSRRAFSSTPARRQDTKQSTSQLIELAGIITRETEKLDKYLKDNASPQPSFDIDGPANFPKLDEEMKKSREEVVRATKELGDLVAGPTESIRWMAWDHNNSLSLHAIYHYKIAQSLPINETTTFTQIAEKTGLDEINVRRFMRHAMTNRIFKEVEPGVVAHTAASRVLAEDKAMQDWVGFCVEDIWPAASRVVDAINLNPSASEPTQAGFQLANNTVDVEPMFVTFGKSPLRAKRMGGAMTSLTGGEGYEVSYLINNYDWATINAKSGTVVDVGGSHGFVCIDLARKYPNLKFIVQDLPKTVQSAPKLEGDLGQRVKFQVHDFHTEQKVKGADVYLYRWIFHNHSDPYAINLLRKLVPALKRGARVAINDHCLPEPNTESLWDERIIRSMDLVMLTLLNARERSEGEFRELFERASEGFEGGFRFLGSRRPEGCRMSIVEAVWEGEDFGGVSGE